jgi:peptide/nickel transport system ATP-binding protein
MSVKTLLTVKNLKCYLKNSTHNTITHAVDDVSFTINAGQSLGVVGASGSGKSTLIKAIAMLNPPTSGEIWLGNHPLHTLSANKIRPLRSQFQLIFQDPFAALNPRFTINQCIAEPLIIHKKSPTGIIKAEEITEYVTQLLMQVGLDKSIGLLHPHQLSGGMCQRVNIARALALKPRLILADEAVSALDMTVQKQIIDLFKELAIAHSLTYLFVSHNLSAVRALCSKVAVMQNGKIVELTDTEQLFTAPQHPYTKLLLDSELKPFSHFKD